MAKGEGMKAALMDSMGTDLSVVDAARVSFGKQSKWEYDQTEVKDGFKLEVGPYLSEKDTKLIKYLATHEHTSPFRHCFATFHIKAPMFVARQLGKHQVGMSWNEISRRYVDDEPEFYWPDTWRKRSEDKKQGSDGIAFTASTHCPYPDDLFVQTGYDQWDGVAYTAFPEVVLSVYKELLDSGYAPEQARMILPQNTYTEWYWSGSLQSWAHMCNLRCKPDTQKETQEIALQVDKICASIWPVSWEALRNG